MGVFRVAELFRDVVPLSPVVWVDTVALNRAVLLGSYGSTGVAVRAVRLRRSYVFEVIAGTFVRSGDCRAFEARQDVDNIRGRALVDCRPGVLTLPEVHRAMRRARDAAGLGGVPFTPALSGDELSLELARYYPGAWRRGLE